MKLIAAFVISMLMAVSAMAEYVPPIGIPAPSFGINEVPGVANVYVNEMSGNDNNPGTSLLPRRSIPTVLEAGTVVLVLGTYNTDHSSPYTIEAHGTAAKPVYILGASAVFNMGGQLSGSYLVLDGGSGPGGWFLMDRRSGQPSDHLVIRNYDSTGGIAVVSFYGAVNTDDVIYNVKVHDLGNLLAGENGGDHHGFSIGLRAQRIWVLDSRADRVSGDGIQINGGAGGQTVTGPVYVGRVSCDHNRQSCWWVKQSHDVIISSGVATNMRPDGSGNPGTGGGAQYFVAGLVFVNNDISNSSNGIILASYDPDALATQTSSVAVLWGNNIHNIHDAAHNNADPRSPGNAIILVGASARGLYNNTIDDVDGGIGVAYGSYSGSGNVVTNVGPATTSLLPLCTTIPQQYQLLAFFLGACRL